MKKYLNEIMFLVIQVVLFYILPLFAGPTDMMGLVLLIVLGTFMLSLILGSISKNKIKLLYPIITAILFIPSIWIYYNESALVHSLWYLVVASVGLIIGSLINKLLNKKSDL